MKMIGLGLLVLLAGCATIPSGSGRGLPEVAMRKTTDEILPPPRGNLAIAVRSFEGSVGAWEEVPGASCQVSAGPYRAGLVTPARLILPDLGPDAPPVVAECTRGSLRGRDVVGPIYPWPELDKPSALQRIAFAGWWYGYQESGPLRYPDLAVGMQ